MTGEPTGAAAGTTPRTRRSDRPRIILDAAEAVLRRHGARGLTMEAVASEAATSKGGVLHHYASKDALVRALVARKIARLREGIARHEAAGEDAAGALVANARDIYGEEEGFPRALLLASAETPEALAEFRGFLAERLAAMHAAEARPGAGAVLVFAVLGLMVGRALGFHALAGAEAECVFGALDATARALGPEDVG